MIVLRYALTREALRVLRNETEKIVVVESFYNQVACKKLCEILRPKLPSKNSSASAIYQTNAIPFFNAYRTEKTRQEYFRTAVPYMNSLRDAVFPYTYPADIVRLQMDEIWPGGTRLMTLNGRKMVFGILRAWNVGNPGLLHQDVLRREIPDQPVASQMQVQIGINVYLAAPEVGGQLRIWNKKLSDSESEKIGVEGSYGYPNKIVEGIEHETYQPKAGDLILINTSHLHSIEATQQGDRITISGFGGIYDEKDSILLWS